MIKTGDDNILRYSVSFLLQSVHKCKGHTVICTYKSIRKRKTGVKEGFGSLYTVVASEQTVVFSVFFIKFESMFIECVTESLVSGYRFRV